MIANATVDFGDAVEFEECLIGSVILAPEKFDTVMATVDANDFYDPELGELFRTMVDHHHAGRPVADVKLLQKAVKDQKLSIAIPRVAELFTKVPNAHHVSHYAAQVLEHSRKRTLFNVGSNLAAVAVDNAIGSQDAISQTISKLESIDLRSQSSTKSVADVATEFVKELNQPKTRTTIRTGLPTLDHMIGGFRPGEMIVLAARPGCGKTSLGWQITEYAGRQLRHVLFVSLEMTRCELFSRVISGNSNIDSQTIRAGGLNVQQRETVIDTSESIAGFPISIYDPYQATLQQIKGEAKLLQSRSGLDLVVIDYIGLLQASDSRSKRYEQVSEDSRAIKRMAKELQVPVLALSQLNRDADGQQPRLSHLRESGSIEQDADMVILLHRDNGDEFQIIVAKNRHGQVGKLQMQFDGRRTRFIEGGIPWKP